MIPYVAGVWFSVWATLRVLQHYCLSAVPRGMRGVTYGVREDIACAYMVYIYMAAQGLRGGRAVYVACFCLFGQW